MDISRWNLSDIMQLPDFVFGAQQCASEYIGTTAGGVNYFKIADELPPWFVIWSILVEAEKNAAAIAVNLSLRLGDVVPTTGTLLTFDRLIEHKGTAGLVYDWYLPAVGLKHITGLRCLVNGKGRHIIGAIKMTSETGSVESSVSVFYTPVPKEAPDWLVKV